MNPAVERLNAIPRLTLAHYPTPLEEMPRLRSALGGGPRLFIKRDDLAGPGFGGNKIRKLDFILSRALADGADTVVTTGGEGSNHARVTAAVCARLGLKCVLVLNRTTGPRGASLYLDELFGAEIHRVESRRERAAALRSRAEELQSQGRKVAEIPLGASTPVGALGYARAVAELADQLPSVDRIFLSTSSGGTHAGLEAGLQLYGLDRVRLTGVSADDSAESITRTVHSILDGVAELLSLPAGSLRRTLDIDVSQVGGGYGVPTPASEEALSLVARNEGIVLDPVYTAKAMAAVIAAVRAGEIKQDETVLFWHTGGQLALFAAAR
jgi:D-cysteine desulfhydrase